jgi:hypothetical protein
MQMNFQELSLLLASEAHPAGYRSELLNREEVPALIERLQQWHPDIRVGDGGRFLREVFYQREVCLADTGCRTIFVAQLKHGTDTAGMYSWQWNADALSVRTLLGAAAPEHRGARLGETALTLIEAVARRLGAGVVHGVATLKTRYMQMAYEKAGWQLLGITSGFDREIALDGNVHRVYEALYAKTLSDLEPLFKPDTRHLTDATCRLLDQLTQINSGIPVLAPPNQPLAGA